MKTSLSQLYRQTMAKKPSSARGLPDAEQLLQLASGDLSAEQRNAALIEMSKSSLQSDLLRFTRALQPHSQALAEELATRSAANTHVATLPIIANRGKGFGRPRRSTVHRALIAGALAASVIISALPWLPRHSATSHTQMPYVTTAMPDRIFAWSSDRINSAPSTTQAPIQDEIFSSNRKDG